MSNRIQIAAAALAVARMASAQAFVDDSVAIPIPLVREVGNQWPLGIPFELSGEVIAVDDENTNYELGLADAQTLTLYAGPSTYNVKVHHTGTSLLSIDCTAPAADLQCTATAHIEQDGEIFSSASAEFTANVAEYPMLFITATITEGQELLPGTALNPTDPAPTTIFDTFTDVPSEPTTVTSVSDGQTVVVTLTGGAGGQPTGGAGNAGGSGSGSSGSGSGSNGSSNPASSSENAAAVRFVGVTGAVMAAVVGLVAAL